MQHALAKSLFDRAQFLSKINPQLAHHFTAIRVDSGETLPFLPIGTFRKFHIFDNKDPIKTFLSSGSTNSIRARHSFTKEALENYEVNAARNFVNFLNSLGLNKDVPILSLIPRTTDWPQSSLAAMIEMFGNQGLNVQYFPAATPSTHADLVVFGTSFHHILLRKDVNFLNILECTKNKRVIAIDTGGTKGRTRDYTLSEVHQVINDTYKTANECTAVSEYGMCELSSQAWSLNSPHDGWFKANDTLAPYVIDLHKRRIINEPMTAGFLAFIDAGNLDSYPAIITEDLACLDPEIPGGFKLLTRAPDASLKGCSLNVKSNFESTSESQENPVGICVETEKSFSQIGEILGELPRHLFDSFALSDLALSLQSVMVPESLEKTRSGQKMLMVLSANIPITFLYPAFMANFLGVKELHLKLPSLRPGDPFSERVRGQIWSLCEKIAPYLASMQIFLHESQDFSFEDSRAFDAVLIFGSDETVQLAQESLKDSSTQVIGLGSITNALSVSASEALTDIADTCSRWFGRGCLTPAALIADENLNVWDFAQEFENAFAARLKAAQIENPFAHKHKILEIESFLKSIELKSSRVVKNAHSTVVDLRGISPALISEGDIPTASAGCGLVYLVDEPQANNLDLSKYPCDPGFFDPHMGRTWKEILVKRI